MKIGKINGFKPVVMTNKDKINLQRARELILNYKLNNITMKVFSLREINILSWAHINHHLTIEEDVIAMKIIALYYVI